MKSKSRSLPLVVLGIAIGSLPYTLSLGKANAQDTSRLKPKHIPAHIDNMQVGNGYVYFSSGGRVYKVLESDIHLNQWWSMPELP